ncbi:hypothetical protein TNCT_292191 [Trichonephila clavata]|uniref:Uncharacterized protein n=1 Tax=Trichonephila clavata TaxID=2740835 RepID=A0A8X6FX80_TRICU|nr:hypothetical protein TNCT_292191 [Trichonephila clavata]
MQNHWIFQTVPGQSRSRTVPCRPLFHTVHTNRAFTCISMQDYAETFVRWRVPQAAWQVFSSHSSPDLLSIHSKVTLISPDLLAPNRKCCIFSLQIIPASILVGPWHATSV